MTTQMPVACSADQPAVTGIEFRAFMRNWATGVAVVTSSLGERPVGCTVNSLTSVSLRPPLLLVCLAEHSRTLAAIQALGSFGINVLGGGQQRLAERFATAGNRFEGVPHRLDHGVPMIPGAMAAAVCELDRAIAVTDHVMVFGRPRRCDDGGERHAPLAFFGGQYLNLKHDPRLMPRTEAR